MKITERAVDALISLLAEDAEFIRRHDYIVVMSWCLNRVGEHGDPGPGIGFYDRHLLPELAHFAARYETGRYELYNGMPVEYMQYFRGCTLDFRAGGEFGRTNFRFVGSDGALAPLPPPDLPVARRP